MPLIPDIILAHSIFIIINKVVEWLSNRKFYRVCRKTAKIGVKLTDVVVFYPFAEG